MPACSRTQAVRAAVRHAIQGHQRLHGGNVGQHWQVSAGIKHTSHLHSAMRDRFKSSSHMYNTFNTWFLGPTNGILIGSAVFARLTHLPNQRRRQCLASRRGGGKETFRGHIASVEFQTPKASWGPGPLWGSPLPLPAGAVSNTPLYTACSWCGLKTLAKTVAGDCRVWIYQFIG